MKNRILSYKNLIFVVLFAFSVSFSPKALAQGLFQLNGNGGQADLGNDCFRITQAQNGQFGSMWYRKKADLSQDFDLQANLNFGTQDGNGADGIVFAFQDVCTSAGGGGGGIGIFGVNPSLFVEFDTWQNGEYNDPSYDHIGILKNGDVTHNSANSLVPATGIVSGNGNVENGQDYQVRIWWTAADSTLRVYVNNDLRATYSANVVNDIFNGSPYVYWGFTAATGGYNNNHQVCMVNYPTNEIELQDATICFGDSTQANLPGGVTYSWTPNYNISSTTVSNPYLFPAVNTTYIVSITDACNNVQTDTIDVTVNPLPSVGLVLPFTQKCLNDAPVTLTFGSPAGGVYSGDGVTGNQFDPAAAGLGIASINYTYTNSNGCSNTATSLVTVNSLPNVSLSNFPGQCQNDPAFTLTGGSPAGGTYSGPGVSSGQFSPLAAGPGTHTITYTYTNASGCVGTATNTIVVSGSPDANITTPDGTVICSGSPISLNIAAASGVSFQWFQNGSSVSSDLPTNTTFNPASAGSYTVVATSTNGCSATSAPVNVTLGTAVTATISSGTTGFCPGDSVLLTTQIIGGQTAQWYFNGNLIPGATGTDYWADMAGSYAVMLTSIDGCTDMSASIAINQLTAVAPNLSSSLPGFCPGTSSITLTAASASGAVYAWYQNGNLISGANTNTYNAVMDGNYYVVVTASSGCSTTSSTINLINASNPTVSISAPATSYCQGSSVLLDAGSGAGLTYSWYLNNNMISGSNSTLSASQAGDYYVVATNATGCTGTSNTLTITEQAAPSASISSSGTTFCPGSSLTLTANSISGATYEWFRNSTSQGAATANNTTFNVTQSGTYYVIINDGCPGTSNSITINSGQLPGNAGFMFGTGINTFCPGESFDLSISNVNNATYYSWTISPPNAASISVGQGTTDVTVNMLSQNATITVTPQNGCGNGGSTSELLEVDNPNFCFGVNFGAFSTNPCLGSTVTYYNYTDNSMYPGATINWDFGTGASPATAVGNGPITVTYSTPGLHSTGLYYVDQFGFVMDQEEKYDYVFVSGVVNTSSISGNVTLSSCSGAIETYSVSNTPGSSYQWTVPANASIISGQGTNQISVNFTGPGGVVSVTETTVSGCVGSPVNVTVNCLTQLSEQGSEATNLNIYPNPASGIVNLSFETRENLAYKISLHDLSGKEIYLFEGSNHGKFQQQFDFTSLSNGMYLLKVNLGEKMEVKRLVINK